MDNIDVEVYQRKSEIFKAIAHPTRLMILDLLKQSENCVSEIQKEVNADFSTVSKHLQVMKAAGLLEQRREKKHVFYSLRVPCIMNFMGCIDEIIRKDLADSSAIAKRCCGVDIIETSENQQRGNNE
ncbi:MAG: metalloregulator ArsR/SmtB family transcription factor [Planctomycetes bacterium]|nr:metalloregulator ArsR/SmtB family transcription factor [Planctomycetota bacterium]